MSKYYNPQRVKNLFDPGSREPFRVSRSKIDLFMECPRCFYLDQRLGIGRPPGFPFSLNAAVDTLLKKEFDIYRASGDPHPLMKHYRIKAVPFQHEKIDEWRAMRGGISHLHEATNFSVMGIVDDLWKSDKGELIVVDYKATAKNGEITLDAEWQQGYKRQMEVYQWLFRKNGFKVSDTGYFVYVNGRTDLEAFDGKLEFDVNIIPYKGNDGWIETTLTAIKKCLESNNAPEASNDCDYCAYHFKREESKN